MIRGVVQLPAWEAARVVVVQPVIVLDNGVELPDDRSGVPSVIGWRSTESGAIVDGPKLLVDRASDRRWEVRVRPASDAVVRLNLTVLGSEVGG